MKDQTIEYSTVQEWSMSQNCFNFESLLISMGRSIGFAPPQYFAMKSWSHSPYINRFVSADTIVPGYANAQSLNRYSYVLNNPLRYTDPTGHMMVEDEGSTKGGLDCRKFPQYCNNGKKKSDKELQAMRPKPKDNSETSGGDDENYCFTHLFSCEVNIDPNAIVDPLAWSHIAEGILGGVVLFGVGDLLIGAGAYVCTTVIGCIAGAPVILAGVAAYPVGVGFIYFGVKSTEIYLDDIFEVTPSNRRR